MSLTIEDGLGSGISVGVSPDNRLFTRSIISTELEYGSANGNTYNLDAQIVTLTSANESGIMYLKNTDPNNYIQLNVAYFSLGKSNATQGDTIIKIYSNPTGGTLLSAGTTVIPNNRNYGLNTPALATALAGTEGRTITGGILIENFILQNQNFLALNISPTIPNGYSVAFSITPPTGNTSMKANISLRFVYLNIKNL